MCAGKHPAFLSLPGCVLPRLRSLGPKGPLRWQQWARHHLKPHFSSFSSAFRSRKLSRGERHHGAPLTPGRSESGHGVHSHPALWMRPSAMTERLQCPSGPKQGWGLGWVYPGQAQPSCCRPGAIRSQGSMGSMAELQPPTLRAVGNGRTIKLHCTFFQERAGLWSVPSHLAHRHLPPMSPAVPRAPLGPRPPQATTAPGMEGLSLPHRPPRRCHSHRVCKSHGRAALPGGWCSCSTPSGGNPGKWQLGFYRHHAINLWVLGRWKLRDLPLESGLRHTELFVNGHLCATTSGLCPWSCFKIHPSRLPHPFPIHPLPVRKRLKWDPPPLVLCSGLAIPRPQP